MTPGSAGEDSAPVLVQMVELVAGVAAWGIWLVQKLGTVGVAGFLTLALVWLILGHLEALTRLAAIFLMLAVLLVILARVSHETERPIGRGVRTTLALMGVVALLASPLVLTFGVFWRVTGWKTVVALAGVSAAVSAWLAQAVAVSTATESSRWYIYLERVLNRMGTRLAPRQAPRTSLLTDAGPSGANAAAPDVLGRREPLVPWPDFARLPPEPRGIAPWIVGVVGPLACAWLLVSAAQIAPLAWRVLVHGGATPGPGERGPAELARRRLLAAGSERALAVTLSGGGYRAALTHAGLLSVLDHAGLPVEVLSTVSGGSITGAAYALGMAPACIKAHFRAGRPGLSDELLNVAAVTSHLALLGRDSANTYARHFRRALFGPARLQDTGPPALVVNVTDYDEGARVAFWRERPRPVADGASAGAVELATLVAASGAFPGAFSPLWIDGRRYVDGGVVENLGVSGLREYLASGAARRLPDVLIVSDVGAEPQPVPERFKPSSLQMAMQAVELSSRSLQQWIYREYTGGLYDRDRPETVAGQPYRIPANRLWSGAPASHSLAVFVLSPTSRAERPRFGASGEVVDRVAGLATLRELEAEEVDATYWVGARLARAYLPAICEALGRGACPIPADEAWPPAPDAADGCPRRG